MLVFLFVLILIILIITLSKIRIEIENFRFNLPKIENQIVNDTFTCKLKLIIFEVIPILSLKIDKTKFKKIKNNNKFKKFNIKMDSIGKTITKDSIKDVKQLNLRNW